MNPSAVLYNVRAPEERNRLTVFFRLLLVIPQFVMLMVVSIAAGLVVIVAWFALVFTGKYPPGMYEFVSRVLQYNARINAYCYLQVDEYPPFALGPQDDYPAQLVIPPMKEQYNQLKVLFRLIIGIPVMVIGYAFGIVAEIMAIVVWLVAVIAGRTPAGLHSALNLGVSYTVRYAAYFALLTEDWPAITQEEGLQVGEGAPPSLDPAPPPPPPPPAAAGGSYAPPAAPEAPTAPAPPEAPASPPPPAPAPEESPPGPFGPSD